MSQHTKPKGNKVNYKTIYLKQYKELLCLEKEHLGRIFAFSSFSCYLSLHPDKSAHHALVFRIWHGCGFGYVGLMPGTKGHRVDVDCTDICYKN